MADLEQKMNPTPYVYACGSYLNDGTEANAGQRHTIRLVYRINSAGEDGHYQVLFETPLSFRTDVDNDYTVMIQPHVQNGFYHLVADITTKTHMGFLFRMSGTAGGMFNSFMITCIRY